MAEDYVADLVEQGFGFYAAHQITSVMALHSPRRDSILRCVAAGADYDYHEHTERCFQPAVLCNGCGAIFTDCNTRKAAARGCPHAYDDGEAARPGDPCIWCDGEKPATAPSDASTP